MMQYKQEWWEKRPPSYTYIAVSEECGSVKIGTSTNVGTRVAALSSGCPFPVRLACAVEAQIVSEASLHEYFAAHRRNGEWFEMVPEIMVVAGLFASHDTYEQALHLIGGNKIPSPPQWRRFEIDPYTTLRDYPFDHF